MAPSMRYEEYCKQKLMINQPFRDVEELLRTGDTYSGAYLCFLQTGNVPPSLAEDIHRLETNERENRADDENADEVNNYNYVNYGLCVAQNIYFLSPTA